MEKADKRQAVPLTSTELGQLHRAAARLGLSPGLLSRALIRHSLTHLEDPELIEMIEDEAQQAHDRASVAGRTAAGHRWAGR